ncbi:alpha/beta fold hydrolase [Archangium primigenium]|uniref:alpha/beta fold hydrolase n=1 Tax=[Archangium] primigenium TaxID=2792470 RepID=UPI001956A8BB|nr:alpha/beta fold hydrolase [Archangium primigenium]MBM7112541.1 alpha/beta fold hydrolase [Archangium primigenium]
MTRGHTRALARSALTLGALTTLALTDIPEAHAAGPTCQDLRLPVALAPGLPPTQHLAARLCLPEGDAAPAAVQVLLPGITYTRQYWDFPDPTGHTSRYSYVHAALAAGYATLAVDRLGMGDSSRPPGALLTTETHAHTVHQLLQALRAGSLPGPDAPPAFQKVLLVGHSYGSYVAWYVGTDYPADADGLVLSGASHYVQAPGLLNALPALRPAPLDPALLGAGYLDPTYLTTAPGTRGAAFYAPGRADPAVIALDEATKSTLTATEIGPFPLLVARPLDLRVPVLLVNGTHDTIFCGPDLLGGSLCTSAERLLAAEAPRLGARVPCVEAWVLPGAGHMLNTILDAPRWFAVAQAWADRHVGATADPAPGCAP